MHELSDFNRPESSSDESWETGDSQSIAENKQRNQDIIDQANSVPLLYVLKHYGINQDDTKWTIRCPFKSHSGGQERSPSFQYYPDRKNFKCFGCQAFGWSVMFVSKMENISFAQAARRVLELYGKAVTVVAGDTYYADYNERLDALMEFSEYMREFIQANSGDVIALKHAEEFAAYLDDAYSRLKLNAIAIKKVVESFKVKMGEYKTCPQF